MKLSEFKKKTLTETGEVLRGDRIVNTPYVVKMKKESQCNVLCENTITKGQAKLFIERIKQHYSVHLLVIVSYILTLNAVN